MMIADGCQWCASWGRVDYQEFGLEEDLGVFCFDTDSVLFMG
jgi:hypothetical protein